MVCVLVQLLLWDDDPKLTDEVRALQTISFEETGCDVKFATLNGAFQQLNTSILLSDRGVVYGCDRLISVAVVVSHGAREVVVIFSSVWCA